MKNDSNLKAQMDYNSNIAYKLKEGAHNKAVEVALKLKNLGYNTSQIIEITDLSKDEIESL